MRIALDIVVDLGEQGTVAEQLLDAGTLHRAVREAIEWHGRVLRCDLESFGQRRLLIDTDGLAQPFAQRLTGLAAAGIEWGGK